MHIAVNPQNEVSGQPKELNTHSPHNYPQGTFYTVGSCINLGLEGCAYPGPQAVVHHKLCD